MTLTAFKTDLDALQLPPKILFTPTLDNFAAANGTVPILRPILNSVVEFRKEVLPASQVVRDSAYRSWMGGETSILEYLDAQQEYNEVVRLYRDALVRHRRAMLDLNTAVGTRVVP